MSRIPVTELGPYFLDHPTYPKAIPLARFKKLAGEFLDLSRDGRDADGKKDGEGPVKYTDNSQAKGLYNCFAWALGWHDKGPMEPSKDIEGTEREC